MRYKCMLTFIALALFFSCKKEKSVNTLPPVTPVPAALLKEMLVPHLPSPNYHFEYNASGRVSFASFASGLVMYNIVYSGNRISEMRNTVMVNKDRLQYLYDNAGRVSAVKYADSTGRVYASINLTYNNDKLIKLERRRKAGAVFIIDKTMTFSYRADGNLRELALHRPPLNGQSDYTVVDLFEQYDDKINAEGFTLIHNEFFDHLVLLPGAPLQKNNARKLSRTGDGLNYRIEYTYTYNDKNAPLTKNGTGVWLSGPDIGKPFPSNAVYSYY